MKKFVIVVLVLAVPIIILLSYFTKINKDNNIKNNDQFDISATKEVKNRISITSENIEESLKEYEINKIDDKIVMKVNKTSLILNDNPIFETTNDIIKEIEVYDNIIALYVISNDLAYLNIYDLDGKLLKEIKDFTVDDNYYVLKINTKDRSTLELSDNSIIFTGTKHQNGSTNSYILDKDNVIDLCEKEISDDGIVTALFKIEYSGTELGDISFYETKETVKDYKTCDTDD